MFARLGKRLERRKRMPTDPGTLMLMGYALGLLLGSTAVFLRVVLKLFSNVTSKY
jgi:hypothetical protein